jgi:hypothetical protein
MRLCILGKYKYDTYIRVIFFQEVAVIVMKRASCITSTMHAGKQFDPSFCFSEEFAKLAARKYARIVQKLGFPVSIFSVYHVHIELPYTNIMIICLLAC